MGEETARGPEKVGCGLIWALLSLAVPYVKQRLTRSKEVAGGILVNVYFSLPQCGMQNQPTFPEFTVCVQHCAHHCGTPRQAKTPAAHRPAGRRRAAQKGLTAAQNPSLRQRAS